MIFVTVGTHEQQFNRLIKEVDRLKKENIIQEEVFIQTGFSDYEPTSCKYKKFLSYTEMEEYIEKASLVITHGGPASFMDSLSRGKTTIIVPRLKKHDEHVNDHQLEFLEDIRGMVPNIVVDISVLGNLIAKVFIEKEITGFKEKSNNMNFVSNLKNIISELRGE